MLKSSRWKSWVNSWAKTMTRAYGVIFVITGMTGFLTWVREPTLPNKAPTYGSWKGACRITMAWQTGAMDDPVHLVDGFRCRSASMPEHPAAVVSRARQDLAIAREGWEILWLWRACAGQFRRDHLWLRPCRRECGWTRCAARRWLSPAWVADRGQRLYSSQPKARIGTTRHWFADLFTEKHARLKAKALVSQLMSSRRLVETVIGQLSERFHIEKVRARDNGIWLTALSVNCLLILWGASGKTTWQPAFAFWGIGWGLKVEHRVNL